jgi:hypothetical protein
MGWQGIEWAVGVFELAMLVVPVAGFVAFRRRVLRQALTPAGALWRYAGLVLLPIAIAIAFFFLLIGIEELTDFAPITEEMGRGFPLLIVAGLVIWLIAIMAFGLTLAFTRRQPAEPR